MTYGAGLFTFYANVNSSAPLLFFDREIGIITKIGYPNGGMQNQYVSDFLVRT
jgi:hypothetical protein